MADFGSTVIRWCSENYQNILEATRTRSARSWSSQHWTHTDRVWQKYICKFVWPAMKSSPATISCDRKHWRVSVWATEAIESRTKMYRAVESIPADDPWASMCHTNAKPPTALPQTPKTVYHPYKAFVLCTDWAAPSPLDPHFSLSRPFRMHQNLELKTIIQFFNHLCSHWTARPRLKNRLITTIRHLLLLRNNEKIGCNNSINQ